MNLIVCFNDPVPLYHHKCAYFIEILVEIVMLPTNPESTSLTSDRWACLCIEWPNGTMAVSELSNGSIDELAR